MSKSLKYQVWCKVNENLRVYKKVRSQVLTQVGTQVYDQVEHEVYNQVWLKFYDQVRNQVRIDNE